MPKHQSTTGLQQNYKIRGLIHNKSLPTINSCFSQNISIVVSFLMSMLGMDFLKMLNQQVVVRNLGAARMTIKTLVFFFFFFLSSIAYKMRSNSLRFLSYMWECSPYSYATIQRNFKSNLFEETLGLLVKAEWPKLGNELLGQGLKDRQAMECLIQKVTPTALAILRNFSTPRASTESLFSLSIL